MDTFIRSMVVDVLESHRPLVSIACRQRAKFEGWLKFELAATIEGHGAADVVVESGNEDNRCLSDIAFTMGGEPVRVELKTANANWQMEGVLAKTRPITENFDSIIRDVAKLRSCGGRGVLAFVLFPVRTGDPIWETYLERICTRTGLCLSVKGHSKRVEVPLEGNLTCDVVVCCFEVTGVPDSMALKEESRQT